MACMSFPVNLCPGSRLHVPSGRPWMVHSTSISKSTCDSVILCRKLRCFSVIARSAELDIAPPSIDGDLEDAMKDAGATFSDDGVALSFDNDQEAIEAAANSVAVFDMSHFGRIRFTGDDRLRFLHNQSTAAIQGLKPGQGCDTVFVTSTGRTIDLATLWIMSNSVIASVSPWSLLSLPSSAMAPVQTKGSDHGLVSMFNKYIFFADKVEVQDITHKTNLLAIIGPQSDELMAKLGLGEIIGKPYGTNSHFRFQDGSPLTAMVGSGLAEKGYQLLLSKEVGGLVWTALLDAGAVPLGATAWDSLRVLQGRPAVGSELTKEVNPLEASLWHTISISKGCYIGQETIAKQITYNSYRQQLFGLRLQGAVDVGSSIELPSGSKPIGKLTSCVEINGEYMGLGYVKRQEENEVGLKVLVNGVEAEVVEVPFLSRGLLNEV